MLHVVLAAAEALCSSRCRRYRKSDWRMLHLNRGMQRRRRAPGLAPHAGDEVADSAILAAAAVPARWLATT